LAVVHLFRYLSRQVWSRGQRLFNRWQEAEITRNSRQRVEMVELAETRPSYRYHFSKSPCPCFGQENQGKRQLKLEQKNYLFKQTWALKTSYPHSPGLVCNAQPLRTNTQDFLADIASFPAAPIIWKVEKYKQHNLQVSLFHHYQTITL
jgi:hypothetical protein